MKQINFGATDLLVPNIVLGCMRMGRLDKKQAVEVIETALAAGVTHFDHADIYGGGACEEIFGGALKEITTSRDKMIIQSKCGIRPGISFDFSKEYILNSVDGILKRLQIDYLDALLLHRPDTLMEPEEVAEAFSLLEKQGKVRYFGVSNQTPMQMALLQKYLPQQIVANQLQFGLMHTGMIDAGIHANMKDAASIDHDNGVLEYCRLHDITIQAWSPYQYGFFEGVFLDNEKFPELNQKINEVADKYQVTNTTIATAWILRHPAKMQTILGTMTPSRIREAAAASDLILTREEWYDLYKAAGNVLP